MPGPVKNTAPASVTSATSAVSSGKGKPGTAATTKVTPPAAAPLGVPVDSGFAQGLNKTAPSLAVTAPYVNKNQQQMVSTASFRSLKAPMNSVIEFFTGRGASRQLQAAKSKLKDEVVPRLSDAGARKSKAEEALEAIYVQDARGAPLSKSQKRLRELNISAHTQQRTLADADARVAGKERDVLIGKIRGLADKMDSVESRQLAAVTIPAIGLGGYALKESNDMSNPFDRVMRNKFASLVGPDSPLLDPEGLAAAGLGGYGGYLLSGLTTPVSDYLAEHNASNLMSRIQNLGDPGSRAVKEEVAALFRSKGLDPPSYKFLSRDFRVPMDEMGKLMRSGLMRRYGAAAGVLGTLGGAGLGLGYYKQNKMDRTIRRLQSQYGG